MFHVLTLNHWTEKENGCFSDFASTSV